MTNETQVFQAAEVAGVAEVKGKPDSKGAAKGTKPRAAKVAKAEGKYKDPYSGKEYESKAAFCAMKLGHKNTNFTRLYNGFQEVVAAGAPETLIDIKALGMETMDPRLPRYVLGFINGGENYKAAQDKEKWFKLTLTKKESK